MPANIARSEPTDPLARLVALPDVLDAVTSARAAVDALLTHRVLRRRSAEVSAESALRGAWAAAQLDGASVSLDAMRAGAVDDPHVQGALRVSAALGSLADTWPLAPRQVLARLHALAAADLVTSSDDLGRPGDRVVAGRLDTLADTLAATRAPAVVVAAVVAGELLALDAFAPATRVVAAAAVRLTLVDRGLDPKSLVIAEVGSLELRSVEGQLLAQYRTGTADGVAGWVRHVAETIVLGAREATAICEAVQRG